MRNYFSDSAINKKCWSTPVWPLFYARQDIRPLRIRCDAERLASMGRANRKIDVLLLRSDRQTSGLSKLAPLGNTVTVSRLQPFSAYSESQKTRPFHPPQPHRGHNRLRSQHHSANLISRIPQRNIIISRLRNRSAGPFPPSVSAPHAIYIMLSCSVGASSAVLPPNPLRRCGWRH